MGSPAKYPSRGKALDGPCVSIDFIVKSSRHKPTGNSIPELFVHFELWDYGFP